MTHTMQKMLAIMLVSAGLASCGDKAETPTPPPPPPVRLEDQFGNGFGIQYRKEPNTEATDPLPGDLIPLSLTNEAVAL